MPQTLTEIREMLRAAGLRPRKMFGQNFLIDHNLLRAMVELANVSPGDVVLEVGPGTGTLTDELLAAGATVLAVEIDRGLAALLEQRYAAAERRPRLLHCDVLAGKHEINPQVTGAIREMAPGGAALVSNLPYNIATPLVCDCLLSSIAAHRGDAQAVKFASLTVTVQREVAQRFTAGVGDENYGPVSVLVGLLGKVTLGKRAPGEAFWPRPAVSSQMLRIDFTAPAKDRPADVGELVELLSWAFQQRRKKMGAASRKGGPLPPEAMAKALAQAGIDANSRPESLAGEDFVRLAEEIHGLRQKHG
jgi:16S rRNA (adenine1518-N6/adenine1519-N6)-dimethyltransferase